MKKHICNFLQVLCLLIITNYNVSAQKPLIPYGSQQLFDLSNSVYQSESKDFNYVFNTSLLINSVWHAEQDQLLEVYIKNPTINHNKISQNLDKISEKPFYVKIVNGMPIQILAILQRDQTLLNLQKAIASLLLIQYTDTPLTELDVSGVCSVFYNVKSSTKILKLKTDCSNWDLRVRYRSEKAFDVVRTATHQTTYDLTADGALLKAVAVEQHVFSLGAKPDLQNVVNSELRLIHAGAGNEPVTQLEFETIGAAVESLSDWYKVYDLQADVDGAISEIKNSQFAESVDERVKLLDNQNLGTKAAALALIELLPIARFAKTEEYVEVLQKHKDLHPQLLDLLGAVQTIQAHRAVNALYDYYNDEHWEMLEKYLQALAVGTFADRDIVVDLFERLENTELPIENAKLRDTLLQTIVALTRRSTFDKNDDLAKRILGYVLKHIDKDCQNVECRVLHIRALQNLNDLSTIDKLLQLAMEREKAVSVAAMQALHSFEARNFQQKHRKLFWQIFFQQQRKFDSTARTFALDILLSTKPTMEEIQYLLAYLDSNDTQYEVKTFVIQKLRNLAEGCARFKQLLDKAVGTSGKVPNYHNLATKGLTTVLSRSLSKAPGFNQTLLSVQEVSSGVLKRGSVDLILEAQNEASSTFKLGIYTNGLTAFVSGDTDDSGMNEINEEEDQTAEAGMEISVQNVLLRPLVFFKGQAELMGHVWSGTASEPTMAYLATVLEQDFEHFVVLCSGASAHVQVIGARSVDLNGQVEMSLWNRNAQVRIEHNAGVAISGKVTAGWANYAQLEHKYELINEPCLSLETAADFYSTIKLCMQLQTPRSVINIKNTKRLSLTAAKRYTKVRNSKKEHVLQGQTLALNHKNNEMCNSINKT